jgi:outer membrane protein assembly factor BamD
MPLGRAILAACLCLALAACGGSSDEFVPDPDPEGSSAALFEEGNNAMREKNYMDSIKAFTRLKEEYPFSPYTIEAELSLADSHYLGEEWLLAAEAYKEFESMHPRHEAMPYVLYQIGVCDIKTYSSVDRPPTLVYEAESYLRRLREAFPGHEYARKAEILIEQCRRIRAEYEIYTGDFFFRTRNYQAAWRRYILLLRDFPEQEDLRAYAEKRRHEAYFLYVKATNEAKRRMREDTWHSLFDWL